MLVRPTGAQAVLIVKAEAEDSTTSLDPPPAPAPAPSPTSSKTCYGTVKQSKPAQAHSYRTPLQLFTEEQALGSSSSSSSSSSTLDRSMMEQWHRMSEVEKDVYRVKASQQVASVSEPRGISLPARPEVAPMFRDPSLPQGWTRQLVLRTRGNTAGKYDVYIYTPDGAKLRSVNEVRSYLSRRGLTGIQPEHISFRVGGPPGRCPPPPHAPPPSPSPLHPPPYPPPLPPPQVWGGGAWRRGEAGPPGRGQQGGGGGRPRGPAGGQRRRVGARHDEQLDNKAIPKGRGWGRESASVP